MKITITHVSLRNIFKLIPFLIYVRNIEKQLKDSSCIKYKFSGFLLKQYSMSLWSTEEDLIAFSTSGAHMDSIQKASKRRLGREFYFLSLDATSLFDWAKAKKLVKEKGRLIKY